MTHEIPLVLLTGSSNPELAKKIGDLLETEVYYPIGNFADGETRVMIPKNIRRGEVFIIQSTSPPVNDNFMEIAIMADAAVRASAEEVVAVTPYYGYARQDRKEKSRVPITASLIAKFLATAGINKILTVDIHSEQQQGFFPGPWDNVYASYSLIPEIESRNLTDLVIDSPDKGGIPRAVAFSNRLNSTGVAMIYKERDIEVNNHSEALDLIGDVEGKNILIVDDIIDSGGTIVNAAFLLKARGARKILAAATHGLFTEDAIQKIDDSPIEEVIITDTITPRQDVLDSKKITIVSVAELLAESIKCIRSGESISERLIIK